MYSYSRLLSEVPFQCTLKSRNCVGVGQRRTQVADLANQ